MAKIILWNSIAKRRRSISDTFYDNGLGTLKGYLENAGHEVEVIDWAREDIFQSFTPLWLADMLRHLYAFIFKNGSPWLKKILGPATIALQGVLAGIQDRRLKKRLDGLAVSIGQSGARIVGIKIWYGEAFKNAQYLIDKMNQVAPQVVTLAGGYHVTLYEEHLMRECNVDLGVACEGEYTLDKILHIIDAQQPPSGKRELLDEIARQAQDGSLLNLLYRQGDEIRKTARRKLPPTISKSVPRYDNDDGKVRIHVVVDSLGCDWGKCNFCVHQHFYPKYTIRDPDEIVAEIKEMVRGGIGVFRFAGSDTPPAFGARIARKIMENDLKIIFGMGSRATRGASRKMDQLVSHYVELIKAGMRTVFMGGECGNDFINDEVMNKGLSADDVIHSIKALRRAEQLAGEKVFLSLALIYPTPLLSKVSRDVVEEDNMTLVRETMPDTVMITPPGPFLHTQWFEQRDAFGFGVDEKIISQAMAYEYVLYKPPQLWPPLDITLEGQPFPAILAECNRFRQRVEKELRIPTDLSDEHFLMFYCAGVRTPEAVWEYKMQTMLDIVSCDYRLTRQLGWSVNQFSKQLSENQN